jgi:two-component system, NarL family, sensor histidine kinase DesK
MATAEDPHGPDGPPFGPTRPAGRIALLVWLFFAVFPLPGYLDDDHPPVLLALTLVLLIAFCVAWTWAMLASRGLLHGRAGRLRLALIGALAVGLLLTGGDDWVGMLVFFAAAAGRFLPPRLALPVIVADAIAVFLVLDGGTAGSAAASSLAVTTLGVGGAVIGLTQVVAANYRLRDAQAKVARLAVAEERLRFSRDLHDLLGHSLSIIALKAELARRLLDDQPDVAGEQVRDIEDVSRRALREVREAVSGYRRPTLEEELDGARSALTAAGLDVRIEAEDGVPPEADAVLAWVVREGTTNVIRHAGASAVEIRVRNEGEDASLEVLDDGTTPAATAPAGAKVGGSGLAGLAERVALHGGRMEAAPRPEGGFRLAVRIPAGS